MPKLLSRLLLILTTLFPALGLRAEVPPTASRTAPATVGGDKNVIVDRTLRRRALNNARKAAAARAQAALKAQGGVVPLERLGGKPAKERPAAQGAAPVQGVIVPGPGFQLAQPDYMFGSASNWHNTKPIHKFVVSLPGLGPSHANELGNFIPVAQPDTTTYPGADYYHIGVVEYTQQVHPELNPTRFRGYRDLGPAAQPTANGANQSSYLGPVIFAKKNRPVRVLFENLLPTGAAGSLFLPVDTTAMGAGKGPLGIGTGSEAQPEIYTQNRALLHLHGGLTPWISDGTPHQWITPAGEATSYKKGVNALNVPDMNPGLPSNPGTPGDGMMTYFYSNQQSSRMLWYHDHTFGMTRLNVYAGEASAYFLSDATEERLIDAGILPGAPQGDVYRYGIPLIIQDKTFVDTATLGTVGVAGGTDPTWDVARYGGDGSLWFPHVYMPNQNPADLSGANGMGRWDYAAWFWPPYPLAANNNGVGLQHGPEPVPGDPNGTEIPGTPNPSLCPEAFMDTAVVNGAPYPKLTVEPKAYRFRILNAANDRFWNLSFFQADATGTEVPMVTAAPGNPTFPATWPTDGREGGVPDPLAAGPSFIQVGNESGFLPNPVVIAPQPVGYNYNRRDIVVLNIQDKALFLGAAERADVIVDFSAYAGKKLILYNDAPAPVPAFDPRVDYYTGSPDQRDSGGAAPTLPGMGPNTRTLMLIEVAAAPPAPAYDMAALTAAFQSTPTSQGAFAESQHLPIIPQVAFNAALNRNVVKDTFVRIEDFRFRTPFATTENGTLVQPYLQPKAIQELFELDYGRMNATLGLELPFTNFTIQTTIPLGYADPTSEFLTDGETQYWKITHNGVDTHPVHFHLFDVQLINRVGWDGAVRLPEPNELGWKDTVKMNPLEDCVVALRPISPRLPFTVPNSLRAPDVTKADTDVLTHTDLATGNFVTGVNAQQNYGWEYVWHCHILGHEENDFMRAMVLTVATTAPAAPSALTAAATPGRVDLAWTDNATSETGFAIQRRTGSEPFATVGTAVPNVWSWSDYHADPGVAYDYQVIAYNQAGESAPSNLAGVNNPSTIQVSGQAYTFDGTTNQPLAGVTLTFSNGGGTATTDASGLYTAAVPYAWAGTLTPALAGFAFTPAGRSFATLTTNQAAQDFQARPVATLSGAITVGGQPLAGVTVALSNGGGSTVTDAAGAYAITVTSGWSGTATPVLAGYTFAPAARTYTNLTADQAAQDYAATAVVLISGVVANGATPVAGVTLTASTGEVATTDANGAYSLTLPAPYTGTLTPSKLDFAFAPAARSYTGITTDQAVQNFNASAIVVISGSVTQGAAGLAGVTVTASTGQTATTDAAGAYTLTLPSPFTGSLTPSLAGFAFTPASRAYSALTTDQTAQGFAAIPVITVSGQVRLGAAGLPGATVTFSTGQVATTDANGAYAVILPSPYTGTLSAAKAGYFISPAALSLAGAATDQPGQDFTAVNGVLVYGAVNTNAVPALPLAGVTVTFSNGGGSVTTDATGVYSHYVPSGWSGSLTPALTGWAFTPAARNLTNVTATPAGQNFTARATVMVNGLVTTNGVPLAGVRIAFSNGGGTVFTDATGRYSRVLNSGWTGTITATLAGYTFSPSPFVVATGLTANATQDFLTTQAISGKMRAQVNGVGTGIPGGLITYTGALASGTATSDANGNFTLRVPTGWSGTVTFSQGTTIYATWTPATLTYTNLSTNVTGLRINGQ